MIAGELIEFAPSGRRRGVLRGRLVRVLEPSPDRTEPACSLYGECGGCNFQHIAYPRQLEIKRDILLESLRRIGHVADPPSPTLISSPPLGYRTRLELRVKKGVVGYLARGSNLIVPFSKCPIAPPSLEEAVQAVVPGLGEIAQGELLALGNGSDVSLLLKTPDGKRDLTGQQDVAFEYGDFCLRATAENFLQANRFLMPKMASAARERVAAIQPAAACDLFCGVGFFTLPLSREARRVYALENETINLATLKKNLEQNRADGVVVMARDLYRDPIPQVPLYLADPPRIGLGRRLIEKMAAARPESILLFSCDSATFARDIALFMEHGYRMRSLTLFDNFPQTDHLEVFAELRSSKKM